jgi:hypothetical protein
MAPIGRGDGRQQWALEQWQRALEYEVDRLGSLPVPELAAEVMITAFAAADPEEFTVAGGGLSTAPSAYHITGQLMDARGISFPFSPVKDKKLQERAVRLVAEGLQELEHASLVRAEAYDSPGRLAYVITRRGRAALDRGQVADILNRASA